MGSGDVPAEAEVGEVEIRVIRATNLTAKDSTGLSDPYCRLSCIETTRSRKKKTTVKNQNLDPEWNERFFFNDVSGDARIVVDVYDADTNGPDDLIGKVTVQLADLKPRGELITRKHELIDGDLELAIAFRPGVSPDDSGGASGADEEDGPGLSVLLPGGPDGPLIRGRRYKDQLSDSPELLADLRHLASRLKQADDRLFEDEDFAGPRALYVDPRRVPPEFLQGGKTQVTWLRPRDIRTNNGGAPMQVFFAEKGDASDIEPDDIEQGSVGDCYLLAALAGLAVQPRLIKDLLVEDYGALGLYGIKIKDWTGWRTIIVDDRFPCDKKQPRQIFCRSDSGSEFWAALFEKAWAKYHGCYEAIEGGDTADTMAYLTGGRMDQIQFSERSDPNAFWEEMLARFKINEGDEGDACFLCASGARGSRGGKEDPEGVPKEDPGGLVSGHAYSVLELREAKGHRLIKLRNPWGTFEWNGDWGDNSPLWTPEMQAEFNFEKGDDGEFWMSWTDFLENFSRMGVVTTIPRTSPVVHVTGSWRSGMTAGGQDELLTYNPRYLLQTNKATKAFITLTQPDTRALGGGGFLEMHVRVFVLGKAVDPHSPIEAEQLLKDAHKVVWFRSGTLEIDVDPARGHHIIVPSLWAPGWEGEYGLTVACESRDVSLGLQELAPLKPDAAAAAVMRAKPVSNKCATCREACQLGRGAKYFKKVRWHDGSHYHCFQCKTPFETERSTESFGAPGSTTQGPTGQPRPIYDVHEQDGMLQGFCKQCFIASFSPRCLYCSEPVHEAPYYPVQDPKPGRVHSHCYESYRKQNADPCLVCKEPILGTYYRTSDGSIHVECYEEFEDMSKEKCIVCAKPIDTSYYDLPEGKVHAEGDCYDKHMAAKAPKCLSCLKPVLGQHYKVAEGAIHAEGDCYDKWQRRGPGA